MSNRILDSDKTKEQLIAELEALRISKEALQQQVTIQSAQLEKLSSEERSSCTILEAPLPMILHAEDGEILKVNQTWTDITGYTHSEIPTITAWVEKAYREPAEDIKAAITSLNSLDKPQSAGECVITTCWGETRIWDFHCAPFGKTPDGRRLIFTTALDVTEQQQAEAALRESEKRLRLALDVTKMGIWDGNILTHQVIWSSHCEELFGLAPGTFDGTYEAFEACIHSEDRECVRQSLNHARLSRQDYHQEFRIVWSDGSIHWLESKGKCFYNEAGEAVRILGTTMDISDRKLAEAALQTANEELENRVAKRTAELSQANKRLQWELVERSRVERVLRESESRFRHLFESNVVGVFFADFSGRITDSNELFLQMGGYTWEDLQAGAIRWDEMTPPMFNRLGWQAMAQFPITGVRVPWEKELIHKNGSRIPVLIGSALLEGYQNQMVGFVLDISDRKFLEEKLRTSEAQMRGVFEAMTDIVLVLNTQTDDGDITDIKVAPTNPTSLYSDTSDIIGNTVEQFFQGNKTETFLSQIRQALDAQQTINFDYSLSNGDSEIWFTASISPLSEHSVIWVARDITVRKQMEDASRKSELWYRTLFESLPLLIWVADANGYSYDFNQQCQNYLGMTKEEIKSFAWEKAIHPDDVEFALRCWSKSMQTGTPYEVKYRLRRADGVYRWHVVRALPLRNEREQILGWIGSGTDIDDLNRAKEAIQREKEFSERLIDSSVDGIFAFDRDCRYTVWNPGMERLTGIGHAQTIGKCAWQVFPFLQEIGEDQLMRATLAGRTVIAKDRPYYVPQTGRNGFFEGHYSSLRYESGEIIGGLAIIRDITDRKIAEAERAKLIDILEATPDFISSSSVDGRILYFNKAARKILGLGQDWENGNCDIHQGHTGWACEVIHNEGIPAAIRDGSWIGETALICHDGREIPLSQLIIAHKAKDGSVKLLSTIARDITQQKQVQATLREAERRWRSLLENVRLLVVGLDKTGKVEFANSFFLELTGYAPAEVLGKNWFETFLPLHLRQQVSTVFWEVLEQEFHPHYTNVILTKSGEERTIAWNNTLLRNLQGEPSGIMSIGEDITERHAVEQMKNEFISIVSHELRTPLTAIRGSLGILATGALNHHPERMQRMIEIATIDTERLVRLVNDILDLERLESGKVILVKEYCDAAALMVRSAEAMQGLAQKENITLSVSPVSALVWASNDQIIQTLTNLLSNAIKFSPVNGTVALTGQPQADCVLFQVKDQGRGIPANKLEKIFGRFQQVDASDSRVKGGTGLGLAICRNIITQHGGRIWAESVSGEGSTFCFTLPVSPEQP
jgi:PAS domain S-box-containing protein